MVGVLSVVPWADLKRLVQKRHARRGYCCVSMEVHWSRLPIAEANPPPVSGTPANTLLSLRGSLGSSLKLRRRIFLAPESVQRFNS